MLTEEQTKNLKEQLIRHIEASFPEDKKAFAISQIESMDSEELEKFLIKNRLIKTEGTGSHCVFCSIVAGNIKSYKIAENSKTIAVLEINPVSHGHVIVIPKEHISSEKQLPPQVEALSKKISLLIKKKLKPSGIKTESSNVLGHEVINVIPIYNGQQDYNKRKPASQEELTELQEILIKKSSKVGIRKIIKKIEEKIWLPKRIP